MEKVLTWEEIEQRFDGEWVVIDEPELTDELEIVRGRVVYHGDDKEAAERAVSRLDLRDFAVWFLGERIPKDVVAIL